jgi:hypothetical protein
MALGFFRRLQHLELLLWQVLLNRFLHEAAQNIGIDRVKLDRDVAETFRPRVAPLGRAVGRRMPRAAMR